MTPNFQQNDNFSQHPLGDSLNAKISNKLESTIGAVNTIKRDRFELLSAYLDGEVTAAERRCVEEWLAQEPEAQQLYARLMSLRGSFQKMPVPAPQMSAEQTAQRVFVKLDRRPKRVLMWGGGAIAAMFIAAVSGFIGQQSFSPQIAQSPETNVSSDGLMIALNNPVIEIPKAPVANPDKSVVSRALIVE